MQEEIFNYVCKAIRMLLRKNSVNKQRNTRNSFAASSASKHFQRARKPPLRKEIQLSYSSQRAEMKSLLLPCFPSWRGLISSGELEDCILAFCLVWITDGRLLLLAPESMLGSLWLWCRAFSFFMQEERQNCKAGVRNLRPSF